MAKKKKSKKTLFIIGGVIVFLIVFLLVARKAGWIGDDRKEVEIAMPKRATITEKVSASGTVQPVTEVKLAPEVSGEIIELAVEEGDAVKKNQPLVKIRPDVWISQLERSEASLNQQQANVQASRAGLARAEATLARAEADIKRQEKLWNNKVISEADWQLAQQNYKIAQNDLITAKQNVEAALYVVNSTQAGVRESRANVNKTSVLAPMTGVVSKLSVKLGERVVGAATMTGTEMMRIADLSNMEVRVNVNENDVVRIHEKDSVYIDVDAYEGRKFKGLVTHIANTAKDKTSADAITEFEVRISILRSSYEDLIKSGNPFPFRPGMTATVEIITVTKANVLTVPLSAVTTRNPEKEKNEGNKDDRGDRTVVDLSKPKKEQKDLIVLFIKEKDVAKMVEVKTGISDYDNIEILSPLSEKAEVITGPFSLLSKRLKDGEKIKIAKPKKDEEKK